jgi:UDP-GlcNAc:undecaprenyl-phosphate/decaprenyl-phosphate GlcNAc-1-phosphate transferase
MIINFFLLPLITTLLLILTLYPLAIKFGFTDKPSHRKQHKTPTPLIGGIAIYLTLALILLFVDNELEHRIAFLSAISLLVIISLIDDYKGLSVKIRLLVQIASALIMTEYADIRIESLGNIFGFGEISLGVFSTPFTVFAVVGGVNAFNMIDGMDGLAGSLTLISMCALALIALLNHNDAILSYSLIFIGSIIAFLSMNLRIFGRSNAKIFLGDNGSTQFGYTVCWLAIEASQGNNHYLSASAVLWVIGLPLFDSVCIMLRRIEKGKSPFAPDREHLHHIFIVAGYGINYSLIIILIVSFGLAFIGVVGSQLIPLPDAVLFWTFMLLFATHYWLMNHAWQVMKISRYLLNLKNPDRRSTHQVKPQEQRSFKDRRFVPSEKQLEQYYSQGSYKAVAMLLGPKYSKLIASESNGQSDTNVDFIATKDRHFKGYSRKFSPIRIKIPANFPIKRMKKVKDDSVSI